ncbi:nucleopolyhedrovirus P10 family protein [Streptomyces sp. CWNU-52B]|uniref:nucleopolyhedrovirus P10 family protein n=1 Tax=unclassified Streptomyces TaxID=2593676 RepID=UPI0039BF35F3
MTADRLTQAVRQQLGLGRLLPLGSPGDGAWITEAAATSVLRRAVRRMPGVRLGSVRLALVDPDGAAEPAVPPPPSALPPGPLRVTAEFTATLTPRDPFPTTAARLRAALASAATDRLGLAVTEVDLRMTGLIEEDPGPAAVDDDEERAGGEADDRSGEPGLRTDDDGARVATAVRSVPGVTRLGAVHVTHPADASGTAAAVPRRHLRVEFEAGAAERTLDVAGAVRAAVTRELPDHPSVAVLVTAVRSPA